MERVGFHFYLQSISFSLLNNWPQIALFRNTRCIFTERIVWGFIPYTYMVRFFTSVLYSSPKTQSNPLNVTRPGAKFDLKVDICDRKRDRRSSRSGYPNPPIYKAVRLSDFIALIMAYGSCQSWAIKFAEFCAPQVQIISLCCGLHMKETCPVQVFIPDYMRDHYFYKLFTCFQDFVVYMTCTGMYTCTLYVITS